MPPARQRLHADDLPGKKIDDGLVDDRDVAAVDGVGQFAFLKQPRVILVFEFARETVDDTLALGLRLVQRQIGHEEQSRGIRALILRCGKAKAGTRLHAAPVQYHARGDELRQPVCRRDTLFKVHVGEQDGEFVAAEPSRRIRRTQAGPDTLRNRCQELVAQMMSVGVVGRLEIVEVDADQHEPTATAAGILDQGHEGLAVEKPGQAVMARHIGQFPVCLVALGDIAADTAEAGDLPVVAMHRVPGQHEPALLDAASGGCGDIAKCKPSFNEVRELWMPVGLFGRLHDRIEASFGRPVGIRARKKRQICRHRPQAAPCVGFP